MWTRSDSSGDLFTRVFDRAVMKQVLIDSLYINVSGGLRLLQYLVRELERRDVDFHLLADSRCTGLFDDLPSVDYLEASLLNRARWYRRDMSQFSSVLCFGNIPAPRKLDIPVYTYFHNINMLKIPAQLPAKIRIMSWLKRLVYRGLKKNTDYWVVQTENTGNELVKHLKEKRERVKIIPFYNIVGSSKDSSDREGYVYASTYNPHKNFEFIVDGWGALAKSGITPTLHLTIEQAPSELQAKIEAAQNAGAQIINHGSMPQQALFSLFRQCRALVYAAINESLGLCLIEAMENGCDIIAPDLPYVYSVCKPSVAFSLKSMDSFVKAIAQYENGTCDKTESLAQNQIEEMIRILS